MDKDGDGTGRQGTVKQQRTFFEHTYTVMQENVFPIIALKIYTFLCYEKNYITLHTVRSY